MTQERRIAWRGLDGKWLPLSASEYAERTKADRTSGVRTFPNESDAVAWCTDRNEEVWADYQAEIAAAVLPLCERYGFGAVIQTASELWKRRDPRGALKVCECSTTRKGASDA